MGQSIAGKGKSTRNTAIKSTSSLHLPHILNKKKQQQKTKRVEQLFIGNSSIIIILLLQDRIVEMTLDKETEVAVQAVKLVISILK